MRTTPGLTLPILLFCIAVPAQAQLTSPQIGWRAELTPITHNVSGSVTIVDENTVRFDDFTYDGGGLDVRFYLGHENTKPAFQSGLPFGPQLFGTAYDGTQPPFMIDLPAGQTLEGWNAISVWCVDVSVNFGSGTFEPVSAPLEGDFNGDGSVDTADYVQWRNGLDAGYQPSDFEKWRRNFGATSTTAAELHAAALPLASVPEPVILPMLVALVGTGYFRRRAVR